MRVAGVSMFWNEADLAEPSVRHMLDECDVVLIADNHSDDGTTDILRSIDDPRLVVTDDYEVAFHQERTINHLAGLARADWIVPFDADEWWYAEGGRIRDVLPSVREPVTLTQTIDMIPHPSDDPTDPNPFTRMRYTRPGSLWTKYPKVAFQFGAGRQVGGGNHSVIGADAVPGPLRIRHYPFRSWEQAQRKLVHGNAILDAAGVPTDFWNHWRAWGRLPEDLLRGWWAEWSAPDGLVLA